MSSSTHIEDGEQSGHKEISPNEEGTLQAKFLSVASHDVRGAMANVRSWAGLLSAKGNLDAKGLRALEVIIRNTDRSLSLLQSVFDVIRAERGSLPMSKEPIPLGLEVSQAAGDLQSEGFALSAEMRLPVTEPHWDRRRFQHALRSFLNHAKSRSSSVRLTVYPADDGVCFSIEDGGSTPEVQSLETAFQPDAQAIRENKLGPGFEMAAAALAVTAQGGWVRAEALNPGARYSFWLPLTSLDA